MLRNFTFIIGTLLGLLCARYLLNYCSQLEPKAAFMLGTLFGWACMSVVLMEYSVRSRRQMMKIKLRIKLAERQSSVGISNTHPPL